MPTFRENLRDHPIQSILTGLASLSTIILFIFFLRTDACAKKKVDTSDEKDDSLVSITVVKEDSISKLNRGTKNDTSKTKIDSANRVVQKNMLPKEKEAKPPRVVSSSGSWMMDEEFEQEMKDKVTAFLPGKIRVSVEIFSAYCYLSLFPPEVGGKTYKRVRLHLGEEMRFEFKDLKYKYDITYLTSNLDRGMFNIKVWTQYKIVDLTP